MTTREQVMPLSTANERAASIHVAISDRPLPAHMRFSGARQRALTNARVARPRLPSLPAANPVIPIAGASALATLVIRGRRRA